MMSGPELEKSLFNAFLTPCTVSLPERIMFSGKRTSNSCSIMVLISFLNSLTMAWSAGVEPSVTIPILQALWPCRSTS